MRQANENNAFYLDLSQQLADRTLFVENFGWVLSQTRHCVDRLELQDYDTVVVHYRNGFTRSVNVAHDSYSAIMKDVLNKV